MIPIILEILMIQLSQSTYFGAMFAKLLLIPFILIALIGLYLSYEYIEGWTWLIVFGVVGVATIYILTPKLNWWYYNRKPPEVDLEFKEMLERHDPFYQSLSPVKKMVFRQRIALFLMGNDFIPQGWEAMPYDIQAMIASAATKVRFNLEEPIFKNCQRVVVFPEAFISPAFPLDWHRSEWFEEDGVVLFSGGDLMRIFMNPGKFLDLGIYEYIRVLRHQQLPLSWPQLPESIETEVTAMTGWTPTHLKEMIGLDDIDMQALLASIWFTHPHRMQHHYPGLFDSYSQIFGGEHMQPQGG